MPRVRARGATMKAAQLARPHSGRTCAQSLARSRSERASAGASLTRCARPSAGCAFGAGALASGLQRGLQRGQRGVQGGRHGVGVEQLHLVGGGVVQRGQEVRALGNDPGPAWPVLDPHRRRVEQVGQRAGVDLAGLAAAGAAVQAGGVRVVGGLAAVAGQHHQRREVLRDPHRIEDAGRQTRGGCRVGAGLRQARAVGGLGGAQARVFPARGRGLAGQGVFQQLGAVGQAAGLHEAEARGGGCAQVGPALAPGERALAAFGERLAQAFFFGDALADRDGGREQTGQLRAGHARCPPGCRRWADQRSRRNRGWRCRARRIRGRGETPRSARRCRTPPAPRAWALRRRAAGARPAGRCTAAAGSAISSASCSSQSTCCSAWWRAISASACAPLLSPAVAAEGGRAGSRSVVAQQQFPGQPDRQQVHDLVVIPAAQPRLPALIRAPRGPAVDAQQQGAEVVGVGTRGHIEGVKRLRDQRERIAGQGPDARLAASRCGWCQGRPRSAAIWRCQVASRPARRSMPQRA